MSFSNKIIVGLIGGITVGVILGEYAALFHLPAEGFIKLLQMTVIPYITLSTISSLGSLDYHQARHLAAKAGFVALVLWVLALGFACLLPLAFPVVQTASFFSTALIEPAASFNFLDLYIPSNPFRSLADGVVPAIVLIAVVLGIALIGIERKRVLLDVLDVACASVARATQLIVKLTPYGVFAVSANAAGTLDLQDVGRIQVYLFTYVAVALLMALWVLPGLITALTPFRYRDILAPMRPAFITAFVTADLFIVLPILTEGCKEILRRHRMGDAETDALPEVIIPVSFNFPHTGKLLSLSFIFFAGWFSDTTIPVSDYPMLTITGFLTFFGSMNVAVPYLLDLSKIPADTFQLFLATGVINARVGSLLAAVHTVTIALLGSAAIMGVVRFRAAHILRYVVVTVLLTVVTILGLRTLFSSVLDTDFVGDELVYGMKPLFDADEPVVVSTRPAPDVETGSTMQHRERIRSREVLRVAFVPYRLPFVFTNREGRLVGFDVEMAQRLGEDLGVRVEFVPTQLEALPGVMNRAECDIAMSGQGVTPQRAFEMGFSTPYLDETLAFLVRDHLRQEFSSWEKIAGLGSMRVGMPDVPYYIAAVRRRAPELELVSVALDGALLDDDLGLDAFVATAERGSIMTLLNPAFTVVVPEPDILKVPLAYPLAAGDPAWAHLIDTWIELKRRDGTIDELFRHWILGERAVQQHKRWSVIRNVLHWVK